MAELEESYLHWLTVEWAKAKSSLADNTGIPLINRFCCYLNAPTTLGKNGWLEMQVLSVDVPNIGIDPVEQELNGVKRYYFKGRNDADLGITFLETPSLKLRKFFFQWLQLAINISDSGVVRNYMQDYMPTPCDFFIFPLNFEGKGVNCDRFTNVFPYDISSISYNLGEPNEVIKTTVKFKYMYHHITSLKSTSSGHISENE